MSRFITSWLAVSAGSVGYISACPEYRISWLVWLRHLAGDSEERMLGSARRVLTMVCGS